MMHGCEKDDISNVRAYCKSVCVCNIRCNTGAASQGQYHNSTRSNDCSLQRHGRKRTLARAKDRSKSEAAESTLTQSDIRHCKAPSQETKDKIPNVLTRQQGFFFQGRAFICFLAIIFCSVFYAVQRCRRENNFFAVGLERISFWWRHCCVDYSIVVSLLILLDVRNKMSHHGCLASNIMTTPSSLFQSKKGLGKFVVT